MSMNGAAPLARVVVVGADGTQLVMVFGGTDSPTLADVECLLHLQLAARRHGGRIELEEVSAALEGLLNFVGLLREVGGQPEGHKELLGLQE